MGSVGNDRLLGLALSLGTKYDSDAELCHSLLADLPSLEEIPENRLSAGASARARTPKRLSPARPASPSKPASPKRLSPRSLSRSSSDDSAGSPMESLLYPAPKISLEELSRMVGPPPSVDDIPERGVSLVETEACASPCSADSRCKSESGKSVACVSPEEMDAGVALTESGGRCASPCVEGVTASGVSFGAVLGAVGAAALAGYLTPTIAKWLRERLGMQNILDFFETGEIANPSMLMQGARTFTQVALGGLVATVSVGVVSWLVDNLLYVVSYIFQGAWSKTLVCRPMESRSAADFVPCKKASDTLRMMLNHARTELSMFQSAWTMRKSMNDPDLARVLQSVSGCFESVSRHSMESSRVLSSLRTTPQLYSLLYRLMSTRIRAFVRVVASFRLALESGNAESMGKAELAASAFLGSESESTSTLQRLAHAAVPEDPDLTVAQEVAAKASAAALMMQVKMVQASWWFRSIQLVLQLANLPFHKLLQSLYDGKLLENLAKVPAVVKALFGAGFEAFVRSLATACAAGGMPDSVLRMVPFVDATYRWYEEAELEGRRVAERNGVTIELVKSGFGFAYALAPALFLALFQTLARMACANVATAKDYTETPLKMFGPETKPPNWRPPPSGAHWYYTQYDDRRFRESVCKAADKVGTERIHVTGPDILSFESLNRIPEGRYSFSSAGDAMDSADEPVRTWSQWLLGDEAANQGAIRVQAGLDVLVNHAKRMGLTEEQISKSFMQPNSDSAVSTTVITDILGYHPHEVQSWLTSYLANNRSEVSDPSFKRLSKEEQESLTKFFDSEIESLRDTLAKSGSNTTLGQIRNMTASAMGSLKDRTEWAAVKIREASLLTRNFLLDVIDYTIPDDMSKVMNIDEWVKDPRIVEQECTSEKTKDSFFASAACLAKIIMSGMA